MFKFIFPTFSFRIERWKWNDDYRIYVSNRGNFKNEYKQNLPVKVSNTGYCHVKTNVGYRNAHRLVMLTWKPIPDAENLTIDHLNHNKRDNSLENLEWVSEEENLSRAKEDYIFVEEQKQKMYRKGKKHKYATLDEAVDACIKESHNEIDREVVKRRILNSINNGSCYFGAKWSYS